MPSAKILKGRFPVKPAKAHLSLSIFPAIIVGIILGSIVLLPVYGALNTLLKALQLILFFVFGIILSLRLTKAGHSNSAAKMVNYTLLTGISLSVLLSTLYIFLRKEVWLMAFSSSAAFALPFYLQSSWRLFISIPAKEFTVWYPETTVPGKAVVSLGSLVVRLKLLQSTGDKDEKMYTVFIPYDNRLGDFFNHFLAGHSTHALSSIEDHDNRQNKFAWEFFESMFFGLRLRRIDPDLLMAENRIKKDAIVCIKRVIQPGTLLSHNKKLFNESIK